MNAVTTTAASAVSVSRPDDSALLAVISRAASDPTIDIEKMERLLAMQERLVAKTAESLFNAAMNHAQGEMGRVATDSENNQTRSRYASYAALDRALRPVYTRHGFSLSFDTGAEAPEGFVRVQAYVSHSGGHTRTYGALMPADGKGAKGNDVMTKTHAFGAASQYGMRYLLKMIFNVAIGEGETDGNDPPAGYDTTDWRIKIDDCTTKAELDVVGEELKNTQGIPGPAMTELRRCWGQKARLVK